MNQQQNQGAISTPVSTNRNSSVTSAVVSQYGNNSPLDSFSNASPNPKDFPSKRRKSNKKSHLTPTQTSASTFSQQGQRSKVTTTMWEDENTICYQVEANGVSVVRRADNDMINGTKLLNVTRMTRGRRDGILKAEKIRHVVKIGSMHLKGVWIPFERALVMAQREKIVDLLYPLFVRDIQSIIQQDASGKYQQPQPPVQQQRQPHMPLTQPNAVSVPTNQEDSSNLLMVLTHAGVVMQQQGNYDSNSQISDTNHKDQPNEGNHLQQHQQRQLGDNQQQGEHLIQQHQIDHQSLRKASADKSQEKLNHSAGEVTASSHSHNNANNSHSEDSSKHGDDQNASANTSSSNLKD